MKLHTSWGRYPRSNPAQIVPLSKMSQVPILNHFFRSVLVCGMLAWSDEDARARGANKFARWLLGSLQLRFALHRGNGLCSGHLPGAQVLTDG